MRSFLLIPGLLALLVFAGCSGSGPESADTNQNANANAFTEASQFTDPNLALTEGVKFLDEGEIDKAIDVLSRAVELDPDLAEGWFRLGIAYALAEKRDEGLEKSDREEPASGKNPPKANSEKAFEKAVAAYKKLIKANDQDHSAHFNLGRAYNKLNEDQDAAKALKEAVELNPEDTEYQTELGAILIKLAQYHDAIEPLKKALELDPENLRAQELLEDAQAGRSRINYSSTPKEDKKRPNENSKTSSNSNVAPPTTGNISTPPPLRPRPTPSRSASPKSASAKP